MKTRATERLLNILIVLGVLGLIYVVGYPQYKESQPSKIRIGVDKSFASLPFYIAQMDTSHNYFVLENIIPELIEITGDPLQGLKDGKYDIAAVPWYSLLVSPSMDGDTVKAFCSLELPSGKITDAILVPGDSKIKKLTDLKGKKLGYLASDEYLFNLIFAKMEETASLTKVTKVPLSLSEALSAFTDKKVDALYLLDPYRGYLVYQGNRSIFEGAISTYLITSLPYYAVVMRKNFLKKENRVGAIRTKNAVEAAISLLMRNPEIGKNYIVQINNWESGGELTLNIRTPEYQRLAEINVKDVERLQTELVQRGIGTCGIRPSEFLFANTDFAR